MRRHFIEFAFLTRGGDSSPAKTDRQPSHTGHISIPERLTDAHVGRRLGVATRPFMPTFREVTVVGGCRFSHQAAGYFKSLRGPLVSPQIFFGGVCGSVYHV